MPDPNELQQFHDLTEEIKAMGQESPEYQTFAAAISATDEKLSALNRKVNGGYPVVTDRDQRVLTGAHATIAQAGERLLAKGVNDVLKQKVLKLMDVAAKNARMLKAYKPEKEQKTLPRLLEDAQAVTLDTRGAELFDTMSGAQSSRQPISYLDDQGKKVTGVFTPKRITTYWNDTQKIFEDEANNDRNRLSPEAKDMLKNFLTNCRENIPAIVRQNRKKEGAKKDPDGRREEDLTTIISGVLDPEELKVRPDFLENAFRIVYPELKGRNLNNIFGKGTMQRLARKFDEVTNPISIQVDNAGIMEGLRTDNRSAAMYSAAELLGVPHLVAKAVPMKLIGKDGQTVEGTFMHKAKGYDPENLPDDALFITGDSLKGTNGQGFKDLADLQVLDYICGNVDRHGSNVFYIFDRNGKFCGVQGIDNDCAFGLLIAKEKNVNQLTVPKNMKVISRSMYDKVMGLSPAELRFALRGFGLSEPELLAAVKRTEHLQAELKKKTIRIVEDKDFAKIDKQQLDKLMVRDKSGKSQNLFTRAANIIRSLASYRATQKQRYQDLEEMTAIGEENRALPGSQTREIGNADLLLEQMRLATNTGWWHLHKGTSPQFEAMRQSVLDYKKYQQDIKDRIDSAKAANRKNDPDAPVDAVVTEDELKEMARLRSEMKKKADLYLEGKQNSKYNSYTNTRKDIARMVSNYGSIGEKVSEAELQTQKKQMKRAGEERDIRLAEQNKAKQNGPVAGLL